MLLQRQTIMASNSADYSLLAPEQTVVQIHSDDASVRKAGRRASPWRKNRFLVQGGILFATVFVLGLAARAFSGGNGSFLRSTAAEESCSEPYGLLPCSDSLSGNLFLMATYGYLLLVSAKLISEGSEDLLEVLDPGLIGGLMLPILGAFPDTLLIAVSGLGGSAEEAQDEVLVGVGVLAGSTIMILTVAWGGSLIAGRCDLDGPGGTAVDRTTTHTYSLTKTGVTTDEQTRWGAWIMMATLLPYIVLQIPLLDDQPETQGHTAALIAMSLAFIGLAAYCIYQVMSPWMQAMKIDNARMHLMRTNALKDLHALAEDKSWGGLLHEDGKTVNRDTLTKMFDFFDESQDGQLQQSELKALILGMGLQHQGGLPEDDELAVWLKDFDSNSDGHIGLDEFVSGMAMWLRRVQEIVEKNNKSKKNSMTSELLLSHAETAKTSLSLLEEMQEEENDDDRPPLTPAQIYRRALLLILAGTVIVSIFADPMVNSVTGFSKSSGIPPFFVAFVVTPIASTASELVSSLLFAMKRRKRTISLTYSQVYGAISMNNTMCLGVFLAIVYLRGLKWEFSSETCIILVATLVVGVVGGMRKTFKTYLALPILSLYPLSIALVAFLDNYLGWK